MEKDFIPFEESHRIRPLLLVVTIVNQGQGDTISSLFTNNEAYFTIIHKGRGTAPREFYAFASSAIPKKEIVISVVRRDKWPLLRNVLKERFAISKISGGISFTFPIDALAGVSTYKMLSNTRITEKQLPKYIRKFKEKVHGK